MLIIPFNPFPLHCALVQLLVARNNQPHNKSRGRGLIIKRRREAERKKFDRAGSRFQDQDVVMTESEEWLSLLAFARERASPFFGGEGTHSRILKQCGRWDKWVNGRGGRGRREGEGNACRTWNTPNWPSSCGKVRQARCIWIDRKFLTQKIYNVSGRSLWRVGVSSG